MDLKPNGARSIGTGLSESRPLRSLGSYVLVLAGIAVVTSIYIQLRMHVNATTVSLSYLVLVLIASLFLGRAFGIVASVVGALCLNYFFLPPFGTFAIEDPQNWVAFGSFLLVTLVVSHLSAAVTTRALQAEMQHDRAARLYRLSRSVVATSDSEINVSSIAKMVFDTYSVDYCSLHVPDDTGHWHHVTLVSEDFDPETLQIPDLRERLQTGRILPSTVDALVQEQSLGVLYSTKFQYLDFSRALSSVVRATGS